MVYYNKSFIQKSKWWITLEINKEKKETDHHSFYSFVYLFILCNWVFIVSNRSFQVPQQGLLFVVVEAQARPVATAHRLGCLYAMGNPPRPGIEPMSSHWQADAPSRKIYAKKEPIRITLLTYDLPESSQTECNYITNWQRRYMHKRKSKRDGLRINQSLQ